MNKKDIDFTKVQNDEDFQKMICEDKKIEAIKRCRDIVNCGLKEASDHVESAINGR